jgi:serine/threonine protein kinase
MSDELMRFGKYLILDHLVDGGMAKICRARFLSDQAEKIVAIKMVQPQYSKDESFKKMFMDELKVAFSLQHPNIIQTYDYGYYNQQLYVAMEYCDGRNLKEYLDKLKQKKFVFPVEISTYIMSQVCQGLHYAHNLTDKLSGQKYTIIHRDISPHNVMLTFDGAVKVIDFGIAKSEKSSEQTQAGTIKGKLSYLAPEYIEGKKLDARYDQFAVGITFWEMLCSRKLFKANNDIAVLKKIQECRVPKPSDINPNVPKELDQIILKALSRNREDRFENLDKMNRALMKFLYTHYSEFNATDLGYFAKELFKEEIKKDRAKLYEYGKIDIAPFIADLNDEAKNGTGDGSAGGGKKSGGGKSRNLEDPIITTDDGMVIENSAMTLARETQDATEASRKISRTGIRSKDSLTVTSSRGDRGDRTRSRIKKRPRRTANSGDRTRTRIRSTSKKKQIENSSGGNPLFKVAVFVAVALLGLYFVKPEMAQKIIASVVGTQKPVDKKDPAVDLLPDNNKYNNSENPSEFKLVKLQGIRKHRDKVYINGKVVKPNILGKVNVPLDGQAIIRVQREGRQHFITDLTGRVSETGKVKIENTPNQSYGFLITKRDCGIGKIYFNLFGEERIEKMPIEKKPGIWIPVTPKQKRELASAFEVTVKFDSESFERNVSVKIDNEFEEVDLCELIQN